MKGTREERCSREEREREVEKNWRTTERGEYG